MLTQTLSSLGEESKSEESPSSTSSYSSRNDVMCSLSILILCGRSSLQQEQQSLKNRKVCSFFMIAELHTHSVVFPLIMYM